MVKKTSLKLALLLSLAAGAKAYGAVGAEVPLANADIGNQAYLSYYTEAGVQKLIQSNIVITRINAIHNLTLDPNREAFLSKGATALFNHTLTNTGNIIDSYDLTHNYSGRDVKVYLDKNNNGILDAGETELLPIGSKYGISNLAPGERVSLLVSVQTLGSDPTAGIVGTISAKSKGSTALPAVSVVETIKFQTGGNAIVYKVLNKASDTSEVDREILVSLKIANDDATEVAKFFKLSDTLDPRFNYVPNSAKFINFNGTDTALTDAAGDNEVNNNNTPVKFSVTRNAQQLQEVNFELENGVPANTQLNTPNGYLQFKVKVPAGTEVGIVPNVVDYEFKPTGEEANPPLKRQSNKVNYEILKYVRATFTGMHIPVGNAGETLRFVNKFVNLGNAPERYSISLSDQFFPAGTTFRLAMESTQVGADEGNHIERPIIDTNGDGNIDTGLVGVGEANHVNVILYATLPINMPNPGSDYKIVKNATSTFKPDYNVKANDTLGTIKISTVDITNNASLSEDANAPGVGLGPERNPVTQISLNPGTTGNFVLHVNNTSMYVNEQYSLEVSTKADFSDMTLPAGVVVKFKQGGGAEVTKTTMIAPGNSQRIDAEVTVAANTTAAVVPLYFRVTSLTTGSRDIKYDSLNINAIRSVQIIPNLTGETYAGGNIVYTHKVRNNGNVLEGDGKVSALTLTTKESLAQWKTETFLDVNKNGVFEPSIDIPFVDFATINGLKAGEEVTIFARVFAPLGAVAGAINKTTITPVVTQGTYSTTPTITSAYDDTKVLAEKLTIIKYQRLNETGTWTTALQKANPQDRINYRIQVKNTGSDEARTLQLKDSIPFYTTIIYGDGVELPKYTIVNSAGTQTEGGVIENKPASGSRGDLIVDIATLAPGATATMEFTVKINGNTGGAADVPVN
ncbi:MAG: hypothetical protein ACRCY7_11155 [Cetobacterium sp.]|uniref:COG1470 family protein n=1 Tax=Cetobacterium sp. TaxID=2071632 RepID=UPI003F2FCDDB